MENVKIRKGSANGAGPRLQSPGKGSKLLKRMWKNREIYLLILPAIITVFIFHYMPIYGAQIAFKQFKPKLGIWGSPWVGFKNFERFIKYPYFGEMLWNTLWINVVDLLFFPVPILFALLLNEMRFPRAKKVCQTITYAPHFVSTVVVCTIITFFCNSEGLFEILANLFGVEYNNPLEKSQLFAWVMSFSGLWQGLGWSTIIYMAALAGVSPELIEAARIDGCSRVQIIRHINLPTILPTAVTMLILRMGSMLSTGYEKVMLLQNALNLGGSNVISVYTYNVGLVGNQYSYSTAIGLFNSLISIVLVLSANYISKKVNEVSLW